MEARKAAGILGEMPAGQAAGILGEMDARQAAGILGEMDKGTAAGILEKRDGAGSGDGRPGNSSIGRQLDSRKRTQPGYSFSSAARKDLWTGAPASSSQRPSPPPRALGSDRSARRHVDVEVAVQRPQVQHKVRLPSLPTLERDAVRRSHDPGPTSRSLAAAPADRAQAFHETLRSAWGVSTKPGRSSMGRQVDSRKRSFPGFSFKREVREAWKTTRFITEEHLRRGQREGHPTPGAKYRYQNAIGHQRLAKNRNAPAYTVGHSQRFMNIPDYTPLQTPGPGHYE